LIFYNISLFRAAQRVVGAEDKAEVFAAYLFPNTFFLESRTPFVTQCEPGTEDTYRQEFMERVGALI
jgi:hypothetical protein